MKKNPFKSLDRVLMNHGSRIWSGKWDATKYRIYTDGSVTGLNCSEDWVRIDRIQIEVENAVCEIEACDFMPETMWEAIEHLTLSHGLKQFYIDEDGIYDASKVD